MLALIVAVQAFSADVPAKPAVVSAEPAEASPKSAIAVSAEPAEASPKSAIAGSYFSRL
jgi:hypothetical protein